MEFYWNQKEKKISVLLSITIIITFFCGCTDDSSESFIDTQLLGTWSMKEDVNNSSFKIVYIFYSNFSFFTGVQNASSKIYDFNLWGLYSLSNSRIKLIVFEQNSTSNLKYSISDGGNTLTLYYEDDINFDLLTRDQ